MTLMSNAEKAWILEGVGVNVRNDGRKCLDFREAQLQLGVVTSAAGSARVRMGGNDVIVGVKVCPLATALGACRCHALLRCHAWPRRRHGLPLAAEHPLLRDPGLLLTLSLGLIP